MSTILRGPPVSPLCHECPCATNGEPTKPIRGAGKPGSLAIVGEGPSTEEMHQGWPFVGPSGKLLQQVFDENAIDRHSIWITNALLCQRPYDAAKVSKAIDCCRPRLSHELSLVQPTAIIALGGSAISALVLPVDGVSDARGTVQTSPLNQSPVISTLHPAAILRGGAGEVSGGQQKMNVDAQYVFLSADVKKAYDLSKDNVEPWADTIKLISVPNSESIEDLRELVNEAWRAGIVAIDLEWDKEERITWLGLATTERAVSLYWPHAQMVPPIAELLNNLCAHMYPAKLFHNLQADVRIWEAQIGKVSGILEDTMLLHHAAFPGAAHDLQNVAAQFLLTPPWKTNRQNEEKQAAKDYRQTERDAKKELKRIKHEALNAERKAGAQTRKRQAKNNVGPTLSASTEDILKLLE